jgi:broad-specificity NMP kinase
VDPANALWIGGPQGSGKSSVAQALAERFGLQLFNVDHRTWVHEARMPRTEFKTLTMDERWVHATPEQMLRWFVTTSRHRFRLVLEDLRELPDEPAVIVEGPQLFPTNVAAVLRSPDQALFLLPDAAEMEERLLARGPMAKTSDGVRARENANARDLLIAQTFEREARELRLPVLRVDRPLEEMIELAAAVLEPVAGRLPRGGDLEAVRRFEADVRATQIRLYEEWLAVSDEGGTSR